MAVDLDGFDYYTDPTEKWDEVLGAVTIKSAGGRRNGGYLSLTPAESTRVTLNVSNSTRSTLAFGIKLSYPELAGEGLSVLATLWKNTTWQVCLAMDQATQLLSIYRNTGNDTAPELLATSATPLPLDAWHHLEWGVRVAQDADDGTVELRMDGSADKGIANEVCSTALVSGGFNKISLGCPDSSNAVDFFGVGNFDDVKIAYGSSFVWTGDRRVDFLPLSGDSTPQEWNTFSGAAWESLNGAGYGITSQTLEAESMFAVANLPYTPQSISSVQLVARATGAGSLELLGQSGATAVASTAEALSSTPKVFAYELRKDPDTTTAWTADGVNNFELGVRLQPVIQE